jgi:hypothetical protein
VALAVLAALAVLVLVAGEAYPEVVEQIVAPKNGGLASPGRHAPLSASQCHRDRDYPRRRGRRSP